MKPLFPCPPAQTAPSTPQLPQHHPHRPQKRRNAGFTLLELVVVMAVLVALASILVPLLPEYLGKANQSAAATNMGELEKAIMTFRSTYSRNPNHFDSMLTEGGAAISKLLPGGGTNGMAANGKLEARALTSGQASRLTREGIKMVYDIKDALEPDNREFHATLYPYVDSQGYGAGRTLATGQKVVMLARQSDGTYNDDTHNFSVMPGVILNPEHDYAAFGIGKYCNLCGPDGVVKEAPVFGQHKQQSTPGDAYQRFLAIYDIGLPDTDTDRYNAKFVGVIANGGKRLFSSGDIVGTYHDGRFDISEPAP